MSFYTSGNQFSCELDSRENVLPVKGITMLGKACDNVLVKLHLVSALIDVDVHSLTDRVFYENEFLDHEKASSTLEFSFLQVRLSP
jgi:hypothetical protein